MTNRSNDDIADALRGLASGELAEGEPGADHLSPHAPQAPTGAAPAGPPAPASRQIPPRPVPQPHPVAAPAPADGPRTTRPSQPGTVPAAGAARATSPMAAAQKPAPAATQAFAVTDTALADDDAVIMPAPSVEYLAHVPHHAPRAKASAQARLLKFRQTVIPVLLTTGVVLLVTAAMKFMVHPDAPLAALPTWLVVVLAVAGVVVLAVGVLNIVQLAQQHGADASA